MPRCCDPDSGDFTPCYASVLVAGLDMKSEAERIEQDSPICPCVTAWCDTCKRSSLIVQDRHLFPCASAHMAHALALYKQIEETFEKIDVDH
jgi:hypothetical protein